VATSAAKTPSPDGRRSSRPRGRPRNVDGAETAQRLIESAAKVCAERGFDGCTLSRIASEADVHPTAIYNHFDSRDALLYAVAVRALEQLTTVASRTVDGAVPFGDVAAMYLDPEMIEQRQVLAEIHVASQRNDHLADLLAEWHKRWADAMVGALPADDPDPRATVQALFLLLLGLCHVDQLGAVEAPRAAVVGRVTDMVRTLVRPPGATAS
jgi:AcrR family transcriptional regulator